MLNPFCRTFREFLFFHFGHFSGIFWHIVETFAGIVPASGVVRRPGSPENAGGKGPQFDSCRGAPVQHIMLHDDDGHGLAKSKSFVKPRQEETGTYLTAPLTVGECTGERARECESERTHRHARSCVCVHARGLVRTYIDTYIHMLQIYFFGTYIIIIIKYIFIKIINILRKYK